MTKISLPRRYFSFVIPMYNRQLFIPRAIESCLKQSFVDFEIIVVDDCSTDNSVGIVKAFTDERIKLVCHTINRGVGPARNTGVEAAVGEWIICLDSDDELLPGALEVIYYRSKEVASSIYRLQFMVQMDSGLLSPQVPLKNELWDYVAYIKWMGASFNKLSETLPVVRRSTFQTVKYYNDRTLEGPYHLDFMKHFNAWAYPDVVRLYHHDAENQLTRPDSIRTIENAKSQSLSSELLLKEHGEALKKYAPEIYQAQISGIATLFFLSGKRLKGTKYTMRALSTNILSIKNWIILFLGLLGPKPLVFVKNLKS